MTALDPLVRLAEAHGVSPEYEDFRGTPRAVAPDALASILEALGVPTADPAAALLATARERWSEPVEPVTVAWDGRAALLVRMPAAHAAVRFEIALADEVGVHRSLAVRPSDARVVDRASIHGVDYVRRRVPLPPLAIGYHEAHVRVISAGSTTAGDALIISAPRRAYQPPEDSRGFGVFAPLYAIHSAESLGIGNLGDLRRLLRWTREHGGSAVGTLPLLATLHNDPEGASPYAPITRLAWDELFLDLRALPEFATSVVARDLLGRARPAIESLRERPLVDYVGVERALWPVLRELGEQAFAIDARRDALAQFVRAYPLIDDYARFRATRLDAAAGTDERAYRTHLYAQFAMHEQLEGLAREARADGGRGLYLDLPVGAHRDGFDSRRFPEAFASGLDAGAPPDALSAAGQNWHFAPASSEGLRRSGYRYFIESVRQHLRYAGVLRVDHVMGLHRIWVTPRGGAAADGAYLNYRADELWAILALESHRVRCVVTGEDLGTVPVEVRRAMRRHGVGGSFVLQYEAPRARAAARRRLQPPSPLAVASLNTHDMPPFEGWLQSRDSAAAVALGTLDEAGHAGAVTERAAVIQALGGFVGTDNSGSDGDTLLRACIDYLGRSAANLVLVSLGDLTGEAEAQNLPGTTIEHPNWRRRMTLSLDESEQSPRAASLLGALQTAREANT